MFDAQYFGGVILFLVIALAVSMFRVLREYERGVIFMLGRFYKVKGPGLIIVIPVLQQMVRVDLRTVVMDVPTQDVISFPCHRSGEGHHTGGELPGGNQPTVTDHPAIGAWPARTRRHAGGTGTA
jgi:hypothetical protein